MISYIYLITNLKNNMSYVGKSNNPTKRFYEHHKAKSYIGNALRKYEKENFLFEIVEKYSTEKEAYEAEQYFIEHLGTLYPLGYNLESGGMGGKRLSEETKKKLSEVRKGRPSCMKGKHHNKETKEKMSTSHKGKPNNRKGKKLSKETKRKISKAMEKSWENQEYREKMSKIHKGKNPTEETKRKMSQAHKGKSSWNKGKKTSKETRLKISKANKGKIVSKETRKKLSIARKIYLATKNK